MEETLVKFTGTTKNVGGYLTFSCLVEYSSNIDPFLPDDLKRQTDFDGVNTTVLPFEGGRGVFTSSSIEPALRVEAEIRVKLQTAYQALLKHRELIERWTGAREYGIDISSEGNHEDSMFSNKLTVTPLADTRSQLVPSVDTGLTQHQSLDTLEQTHIGVGLLEGA